MALEPGTALGNYEIVSSLGEGGMGEVYRAKDTKLGREVAIKVLPEMISATSFRLSASKVSVRGEVDDHRQDEFEEEARLLASLNHPNIATVFGFETSDQVSYLVMELVEGKTLAEKLSGGTLDIEEALKVFLQIADGLEAAHERGIAHCDLKPANVMVTAQGVVKLLDFGVARALSGPEVQAFDPDLSPTLTQSTATSVGTILYMSPEQARGLRGDTASDIWAFGCCLFEALTGKRPFFDANLSDILVKILDREPDFESLPDTTPRRVRDLIRRCLSKERSGRLRHIGDAGLELRDALSEEAEAEVPLHSPGDALRSPLPWLAAALTGLLVGISATLFFARSDDGADSTAAHSLQVSRIGGSDVRFGACCLLGSGGRKVESEDIDHAADGSESQRCQVPLVDLPRRRVDLEQVLSISSAWGPEVQNIGELFSVGAPPMMPTSMNTPPAASRMAFISTAVAGEVALQSA